MTNKSYTEWSHPTIETVGSSKHTMEGLQKLIVKEKELEIERETAEMDMGIAREQFAAAEVDYANSVRKILGSFQILEENRLDVTIAAMKRVQQAEAALLQRLCYANQKKAECLDAADVSADVQAFICSNRQVDNVWARNSGNGRSRFGHDLNGDGASIGTHIHMPPLSLSFVSSLFLSPVSCQS